jgi:hypothetical protein
MKKKCVYLSINLGFQVYLHHTGASQKFLHSFLLLDHCPVPDGNHSLVVLHSCLLESSLAQSGLLGNQLGSGLLDRAVVGDRGLHLSSLVELDSGSWVSREGSIFVCHGKIGFVLNYSEGEKAGLK